MIDLIINEERYENVSGLSSWHFTMGRKFSPGKTENEAEAGKKMAPEKAGRTLEAIYGGNSLRLTLRDEAGRVLGERLIADFPEERKAGKNCLKTGLYDLLCEVTGRTLPWGTLTGIRPTKIPMTFYDAGYSIEEAAEHLRQTYKVSEEKIRLCTRVASNEKRILEGIDGEHSFSLYVGIPFCPTICLYCSFPPTRWAYGEPVDDYLEALFKEIRRVSRMVDKRCLTTVYMGGGTPTSLTGEQMDRLLYTLEENFDLDAAREFTIEAGRPDSIDESKLQVMKAHGIQRISINPQTLNQKTLDVIGRRHTVEDVERAFYMARQGRLFQYQYGSDLGSSGRKIRGRGKNTGRDSPIGAGQSDGTFAGCEAGIPFESESGALSAGASGRGQPDDRYGLA